TMAAFKITVFSCLITLMLTLYAVESINAELDNGDIRVTKDDILRALYNYMLYEPKGSHDFDGFERAQRSGKPTFIRFGKRSANIVTNPENI
uniref:Uncharacterized protein n=2 Tax=Parascaris TaxID=6254 RepID=A0A915BVY5_PARUN